MATVTIKQPKSALKFIGKAWLNKVPEDAEQNAGVEYITVRIDRDKSVALEASDRLTLWPNVKRTDEFNARTGQPFIDADFNVAVNVTEEEAAA